MDNEQILENRIKCGTCGTEFDLNKNMEGCPLCGFGRDSALRKTKNTIYQITQLQDEYFKKPPHLDLLPGRVISDDETNIWGSWLMFNDFVAPKFLIRIIAWKMYNEKNDNVLLSNVMNEAINLIKKNRLSQFKGFPNLQKDRNGQRLVDHFLKTCVKMGLVTIQSANEDKQDILTGDWDKIKISLSREGLEFSQLSNPIFDDNKNEQILSTEERNWLLKFLKKIDKEGYKEYTVLKQVYEFLKAGNNGNKDLWNWFVKNPKFREYIPKRSKRAEENQEIFEKQIWNYARSFSSAKISLLRELGLIKNKRNDYTITGEML